MTKICSVSSGAAGHTVEAAHMIVMQESQFIGINAAQLKRVKEAVQASVLEAADGAFRTTAQMLTSGPAPR